VEIHPSARRHGIADADISTRSTSRSSSTTSAMIPDRWLVIGPDQAANLLELVVLVTAEGNELTIHAMPLRAVYRKLLEP
jgi:hypothetical protein